MEWNIFNGFRTLSANIAVELPEAVQNSTHYRTLFLAALALFAMTFVLNTAGRDRAACASARRRSSYEHRHTAARPTDAPAAPRPRRRRRRRAARPLLAHGEPMVWLTGGGLVVCLVMIVGLLALVLVPGRPHLLAPARWCASSCDGDGTWARSRGESYAPRDGVAVRTELQDGRRSREARRLPSLVRTGNFELTGEHFHWVERRRMIVGGDPAARVGDWSSSG